MIRFLSVQAPYLVGILHPFASRLGKIEGLTDVLCVNLDSNQLKTLNMANPRTTVPDMLKKVGKKSSSDTLGAAECLARDLDEIVKADLTLWQQEEIKAGGFNEKGGTKENGVNPLDASESGRNITLPSEGATKQTFIHKMKNPLKMSITSAKKEKGAMSLEEKRQYETSVDAAVAFGKMIRKSFGKDGGEGLDESDNIDHDDDIDNQANTVPRYVAPSHDIGVGSSGVEPSSVAEGGRARSPHVLLHSHVRRHGNVPVGDARDVLAGPTEVFAEEETAGGEGERADVHRIAEIQLEQHVRDSREEPD